MQAKLLKFFGSQSFLFLIIGVFVVEALWVAFTGRYPGAFDENFHLGLIKIYAHHWLPFLDAQPPDAEVYGAVARDPSYLYHYLLSFPYRFISLFVESQNAQIVILRVLNVCMVALGLVVYAKILRRTGLSSRLQHVIMILFTIVPVLPLLAGQINYDNLLFIFVGLSILWTLRFTEHLRLGMISGRILSELVIFCLLGSLTKYAFLPLFMAIILFIAVQLVRYRKLLRNLWHTDKTQRVVSALKRSAIIGILLFILLLGALNFQRYGINVVRYHTLIPDCAQVLSVDECLGYAPWQRDYFFVQNNGAWHRESLLSYSNMWIHQMVRELYFSVYGAFFPDGTVDYKVAEPLPVMIILGWTVLLAGTGAVLLCLPRLWHDPTLQLFGGLIVLYLGILFFQNYKMYVETAVPVAIHGRYLLPVFPLLLALYFRAFVQLFQLLKRRVRPSVATKTRVALASWLVLFLVCLQGGGILTHIVRSDSLWFWQESVFAQKLNESARNVLKPLIIEKIL